MNCHVLLREICSHIKFLIFPGDPILRQESQLCLTATSLVFLNQCFENVTSGKITNRICVYVVEYDFFTAVSLIFILFNL